MRPKALKLCDLALKRCSPSKENATYCLLWVFFFAVCEVKRGRINTSNISERYTANTSSGRFLMTFTEVGCLTEDDNQKLKRHKVRGTELSVRHPRFFSLCGQKTFNHCPHVWSTDGRTDGRQHHQWSVGEMNFFFSIDFLTNSSMDNSMDKLVETWSFWVDISVPLIVALYWTCMHLYCSVRADRGKIPFKWSETASTIKISITIIRNYFDKVTGMDFHYWALHLPDTTKKQI